MSYRQLYILVEGVDDEEFFEKIIKPVLEQKWDTVEILKYAQWPPKKRREFLSVIQKMALDYIYVADNDQANCITLRKEKILKKIQNLDTAKIQIVIEMIESWYLAGLSKTSEKALRVSNLQRTNRINKQQFEHLKPEQFKSRADFMNEILKNYSIETARQKNASFNYFFDKYCA